MHSRRWTSPCAPRRRAFGAGRLMGIRLAPRDWRAPCRSSGIALGWGHTPGFRSRIRRDKHALGVPKHARCFVRRAARHTGSALNRGTHRVDPHRRVRCEAEQFTPLVIIQRERETRLELVRVRFRRSQLISTMRGASYHRRALTLARHSAVANALFELSGPVKTLGEEETLLCLLRKRVRPFQSLS